MKSTLSNAFARMCPDFVKISDLYIVQAVRSTSHPPPILIRLGIQAKFPVTIGRKIAAYSRFVSFLGFVCESFTNPGALIHKTRTDRGNPSSP